MSELILGPPTITSPENTLLLYIDKLQRANADDLAFYPLTTLEKALDEQKIMLCYENDEAAGYLWYGALRGGKDVVIYQACVDYDVRRRHLGHKLVADLIAMARASGSTGIRLKCASSADSNEFWQAIGFYCTRVTDGGAKRSRKINYYRIDLSPTLFTLDSVTPSDAPINLKSYNKAKREGIVMPSRFSRSHYGKDES